MHARSIGQFYANRELEAPRVHTTENFEKAALFLLLALPSTLISHEYGAFGKRSSNKEEFENSGFAF